MDAALADPDPHLQGRGDARGLEAGAVDRPLRPSEGLRDLRLVGRARPEDQGGRPAGAGGLLHDPPGADEPELRLLPRLQHRLPERVRPLARAHRLGADGARRLLVARLLFDDRREHPGDLHARPARLPGRPARVPGAGVPLPHDAGKHGAAPQRSEHAVLADAEGGLRPLRGDRPAAEGRRLRPPLRLQRRAGGGQQLQRVGAVPADVDAGADPHRARRQGGEGRRSACSRSPRGSTAGRAATAPPRCGSRSPTPTTVDRAEPLPMSVATGPVSLEPATTASVASGAVSQPAGPVAYVPPATASSSSAAAASLPRPPRPRLRLHAPNPLPLRRRPRSSRLRRRPPSLPRRRRGWIKLSCRCRSCRSGEVDGDGARGSACALAPTPPRSRSVCSPEARRPMRAWRIPTPQPRRRTTA